LTNLPLLRLPTTGSDEISRIRGALDDAGTVRVIVMTDERPGEIDLAAHDVTRVEGERRST
jgi:hypothetical protein